MGLEDDLPTSQKLAVIDAVSTDVEPSVMGLLIEDEIALIAE